MLSFLLEHRSFFFLPWLLLQRFGELEYASRVLGFHAVLAHYCHYHRVLQVFARKFNLIAGHEK